MPVGEAAILREIMLWPWSECGSYGAHVRENFPTLVCMGCTTTYGRSLRGERELCARASIGGGGGYASPTFQRGGQHRNCPPTFQQRQIRRHIA